VFVCVCVCARARARARARAGSHAFYCVREGEPVCVWVCVDHLRALDDGKFRLGSNERIHLHQSVFGGRLPRRICRIQIRIPWTLK